MNFSITSLPVGAGRALAFVLPLTGLLLLHASANSPAQEASSEVEAVTEPTPEGLRRVPLDENGGAPGRLQRIPVESEVSEVDREQWRKRLSENDLDLRERALDDLLERARTDERLIAMLREWSDAPADNDIAWTARLALRELERTRSASPYPQSPFMEQLRGGNLLEPLFGDLDRFGRGMQQGLESLFDELREFEDVVVPRGTGKVQEESRKVELRVEPSGVTCEVTECIDGKEVTEEFQADTLDELIAKHPELKEHVEPRLSPFGGALGRGTSRLPRSLDSLFEGDFFRELDRAFGGGGSPFLKGSPRTDILGIRYKKAAESRIDRTLLQPGQGLWVEGIEPGTLAAEAGVKRGDLLVEIDGKPIFEGQDVSDALAERGEFDELRLLVIGRRGDRRELIWQPPSEIR